MTDLELSCIGIMIFLGTGLGLCLLLLYDKGPDNEDETGQ